MIGFGELLIIVLVGIAAMLPCLALAGFGGWYFYKKQKEKDASAPL